MAVSGHVTRNWLQFHPIVVQFSLPRSPYATIITNIHNYDIATAFTGLRSEARVLLGDFYIVFLISHAMWCACARVHVGL